MMSSTALKTYVLERDGSHKPFGSAHEYTGGLFDQVATKSKRIKKSPASKIRWIPKGESIEVGGRRIAGMVYVTDTERSKLSREEDLRLCINTTVPVAKRRKKYKAYHDEYYEHYCNISSTARAVYLDWLESGRESKKYTLECIMRYFAGLERRFMYDDPGLKEKEDILAEIERLLGVYGSDEFIEYYLRVFRDFAVTLTYPNEVAPLIDKENTKFPLSLAIGLGRLVMQKKRINADWALSWYLCTPELTRSKVVYQCWQEFIVLFRQVFMKQYPNGLYVRSQGFTVVVEYYAISADDFYKEFTFKASDGKTVPDIVSLSKPIDQLEEIAHETVATLKSFNSYLQRNPDGRGTVDALARLPRSLWTHCVTNELNIVEDWATSAVNDQEGYVDISEFVTITGISCKNRPSSTQTGRAADLLALVGFGVVQDPRFELASTPLSPTIKLFAVEPTDNLESITTEVYSRVSLALAVGMWIADQVDIPTVTGKSESRTILKNFIETFDELNAHEKARLSATVECFADAPPSLQRFTKKLKDSTDDTKSVIRRLVVTILNQGYAFESLDFTKIEEVYVKLGFEPKQVWEDIRNRKDIIREGNIKNAGFNTKAKVKRTVTLDKEKIDELVSETELVKKVLGEVFDSTTDQADTQTTKLRTSGVGEVFAGLDGNYIPLIVELLAKKRWTHKAAEKLAKKYGLMWEGSLEAINEWAFEQFDEELIEEYDGFSPNIATVKKLRQRMQAFSDS